MGQPSGEYQQALELTSDVVRHLLRCLLARELIQPCQLLVDVGVPHGARLGHGKEHGSVLAVHVVPRLDVFEEGLGRRARVVVFRLRNSHGQQRKARVDVRPPLTNADDVNRRLVIGEVALVLLNLGGDVGRVPHLDLVVVLDSSSDGGPRSLELGDTT